MRTINQNDKTPINIDLEKNDKTAYTPAYKDTQKDVQNQTENLPDDLATVLLAWPELPEYIKKAIMALIHTTP